MANEIITTLHPDHDPDTNIYPNIKKDNIPNQSVDYTKIKNGTLDFVTPEMFGAIGDGVNDDTLAIQNAINSGYMVILDTNKTYLFSSTLIFNNIINFDGNFSHLIYDGDDIAISINNTNSSHSRDVGLLKNIYLTCPTANIGINIIQSIKSKYENIRIYDFGNIAIYFAQGSAYENVFDNIYLFGRKGLNTIGIKGSFGDCDFGNLYGCNVKLFFDNSISSAFSVKLIHAWCSNDVNLPNETSLSQEDYDLWWNETVLIKMGLQEIGWQIYYNYVYADTYKYAIDWSSYARKIKIGYIALHGGTTLYRISNQSTKTYLKYLYIEDIDCDYSILNTNYAWYPEINRLNNRKVEKIVNYTLSNDINIDVPINKFILFRKQITTATSLKGFYLFSTTADLSSNLWGSVIKSYIGYFNTGNNETKWDLPNPSTLGEGITSYYVTLQLGCYKINQSTPFKYQYSETLSNES